VITSLSLANSFAARARSGRLALAVLSLALLAGCATRADLLQVQQDQREVRALLADQQVAVEGLRRRLDILRGEMSEGGRRGRGGGTSSDVRQQLADLEARVMALEQARGLVVPTPPSGTAPAPEELLAPRPPEALLPPVAPTPARPPTAQEAALAKEEAALGGRGDAEYREAIGLIRQGQCGPAIPKLRDFIRKNPKSDLADNAQYWIGSCYYSQRDYNRAIIELNEVLLKFPKADKVPPALLMLADAFADSGDKIDARLILQKLIADHGKSEEAEKARQKLQALGE
jgi:tol-pal system protein YbgF